jgi:pyruvate formate lyase activating enzyme
MSNNQEGLIFNIQRFSLHDGPGIRTTIFFKGCPLSCVWCHNPEGINPHKQLFFKSFICDLCGNCLDVCLSNVFTIKKENLILKRKNCDFCGKCVQACHKNALELCGMNMSPKELLNEVLKDSEFYETSNGGITLSGGEPLMQFEFIKKFLKKIKPHNIHSALDTSGYAEKDQFKDILRLIDLVLFDVKTLNKARHRKLTGVSNDLILSNLKECANRSVETIIRIPVIYGYNFINLHDELTNQILQLYDLGFSQFQIIPYHKFGEQKYEMLGKPYTLSMESNHGKLLTELIESLKSKTNIKIEIIEPILT